MYWEIVVTAPKGVIKYHVRLCTSEHRTVVRSLDYTTIEGAEKALEIAQEYAATAPVYEADDR